MRAILLSLLVALAISTPIYKQCDDQWKNEVFGTSGNQTLCDAGSLITSISMFLKECNKQIDGNDATPKTLNAWLKSNNGFGSSNEIDLSVMTAFGFQYLGQQIDSTSIKRYYKKGSRAILKVNNGQHWVLMTGFSSTQYQVNDPLLDKSQYQQSDASLAELFFSSRCRSMDEPAIVEDFLE